MADAIGCIDRNGEHFGKDGRECETYEVSDCGTQDDSDFKSNELCCICGGGNSGNMC